MAEQAGPATWAINTDEQQETSEQAERFLQDNKDIIDALKARITELMQAGDGDSLLFLSQYLYSTGAELAKWLSVNATVIDTDKVN